MTDPDPRDQVFQRLIGMAHKRPDEMLRQVRAARVHRPGGFRVFVEMMWPVVEPARKFVSGWHIDAVTDHLESVSSGEIKRLLINIPPGSSKALDDDTPILTTWGWKRHGDLIPGDFVYGTDDQPKRVLAVTEPWVAPVTKITFDDGAEIVAAQDHLWAVEREGVGVIVPTSDLRLSPPDRIKSGKLSAANTQPHRYIKELSRVSDRSVRCIQVQDRMYLAGKELVPTHNSLLCNVFWPAWEWTTRPHLRYLCFSYSQALTIRDNVRFRQLITSPEYKQLWGHVFDKSEDQFSLVTVANNKTGFKYASGISGSATGHRADRLICFPADTPILTTQGNLPIGQIVRERMNVGIIGSDGNGGVLQQIEEYEAHQSPDSLVGLQFADGRRLHCTDDHPIFIVGQGWVAAGRVGVGDHTVSHRGMDAIACGKIVAIERVEKPADGIVFNLRVSPCHNYFACGTLVHNCDDPNNASEAESEIVRDATNMFFKEVLPSRLANPDDGAIVVIQQRVHAGDVSGTILSSDMGFEHLMIPMLHDGNPRNTCIGWRDPRSFDPRTGDEIDNVGALMWPGMYPARVVDQLQRDLGPVAFAGQYQQIPVPRGGAIFDVDHWQDWPNPMFDDDRSWVSSDKRIIFPPFEYVVAAVDTAFTEREENDYSAMVIMGVFRGATSKMASPAGQRDESDPVEFLRIVHDDRPKVMLVFGWQKRLTLHGPPERIPMGITQAEWQGPDWREERQRSWGLVEWVADTCKRYKVDQLLIETQAQGHGLEQELRRLHSSGAWGVELIHSKGRGGGKTERAWAVQHLFTNGLVFCPKRPDTGLRPAWAEMIVNQMAMFPRDKHDDLVDCVIQCLAHLRETGILVRGEEFDADYAGTLTPTGRAGALYEV